jgi:hypothetical protein
MEKGEISIPVVNTKVEELRSVKDAPGTDATTTTVVTSEITVAPTEPVSCLEYFLTHYRFLSIAFDVHN